MTVHAPQPPPPQPYLVPVSLTEVRVKESLGGTSTGTSDSQKGFAADLKDTFLSEEGEQRGFRVSMVLCNLGERKFQKP